MQVKALALFHMGLFNFFLSLWVHFRIVYTHTFPSSCIRLCQHLLYCIPDLFTTFFDLIPAGVWMYLCICVSVCVCVSARMQNRSLQGDVRGMRALRDELDCARERAARSEQLQTELQSCKHRLRSLELTRTQLKVHTHTKHTSHTIEKSSNTATSPLQNT